MELGVGSFANPLHFKYKDEEYLEDFLALLLKYNLRTPSIHAPIDSEVDISSLSHPGLAFAWIRVMAFLMRTSLSLWMLWERGFFICTFRIPMGAAMNIFCLFKARLTGKNL